MLVPFDGDPTRKMFLELSVLRAFGSVACPRRRPRKRKSSIFYPVRKYQWRKPLPGSQGTRDSSGVGFGPGGRRPWARPERRPAVTGKWVGVGWVASTSGSQISRADNVGPQGNPWWTALSTPTPARWYATEVRTRSWLAGPPQVRAGLVRTRVVRMSNLRISQSLQVKVSDRKGPDLAGWAERRSTAPQRRCVGRYSLSDGRVLLLVLLGHYVSPQRR